MIRVLRLIEYVYPDNETAEADMGRWYLAANGTKAIGKDRIIRSAVLTDLNFSDPYEFEEDRIIVD